MLFCDNSYGYKRNLYVYVKMNFIKRQGWLFVIYVLKELIEKNSFLRNLKRIEIVHMYIFQMYKIY